MCPTHSRSAEIITYGRTKLAIVGIALFALVYNLPRFFEITWTYSEPVSAAQLTDAHALGESAQNASASARAEIITTSLRENPIYISVYITWMYLVFMYALPFSGLTVLNILIFLDVR